MKFIAFIWPSSPLFPEHNNLTPSEKDIIFSTIDFDMRQTAKHKPGKVEKGIAIAKTNNIWLEDVDKQHL